MRFETARKYGGAAEQTRAEEPYISALQGTPNVSNGAILQHYQVCKSAGPTLGMPRVVQTYLAEKSNTTYLHCILGARNISDVNFFEKLRRLH